jgi:hypothetical protein
MYLGLNYGMKFMLTGLFGINWDSGAIGHSQAKVEYYK